MLQDPLEITHESSGAEGQRILHLQGPITLTNLFQFQDLVRSDKSRHLILDMAHVPYVDSAGIGVLVGAYVSRQRDGRKLVLAGVTDRVRTTLRITQVEQFFEFYDGLSDAQNSLSQT